MMARPFLPKCRPICISKVFASLAFKFPIVEPGKNPVLPPLEPSNGTSNASRKLRSMGRTQSDGKREAILLDVSARKASATSIGT